MPRSNDLHWHHEAAVVKTLTNDICLLIFLPAVILLTPKNCTHFYEEQDSFSLIIFNRFNWSEMIKSVIVHDHSHSYAQRTHALALYMSLFVFLSLFLSSYPDQFSVHYNYLTMRKRWHHQNVGCCWIWRHTRSHFNRKSETI